MECDFTLITGLRIVKQLRLQCPGSMTLDQLNEKALLDCPQGKDKYKLALIYFVHATLLGNQKLQPIDLQYLQLVDDLENLCKIPPPAIRALTLRYYHDLCGLFQFVLETFLQCLSQHNTLDVSFVFEDTMQNRFPQIIPIVRATSRSSTSDGFVTALAMVASSRTKGDRIMNGAIVAEWFNQVVAAYFISMV